MKTVTKCSIHLQWRSLLEEYFLDCGMPPRYIPLLTDALDADADSRGPAVQLSPELSNWVRSVLAACDPNPNQPGKWRIKPEQAKAVLAKGFHVYFAGHEEALRQVELDSADTAQSQVGNPTSLSASRRHHPANSQ